MSVFSVPFGFWLRSVSIGPVYMHAIYDLVNCFKLPVDTQNVIVTYTHPTHWFVAQLFYLKTNKHTTNFKLTRAQISKEWKKKTKNTRVIYDRREKNCESIRNSILCVSNNILWQTRPNGPFTIDKTRTTESENETVKWGRDRAMDTNFRSIFVMHATRHMHDKINSIWSRPNGYPYCLHYTFNA